MAKPKKRDPLDEGVAQFDQYLDRLGLDQGCLVLFDRRPDAPPPEDRTSIAPAHTPKGRAVTLVRA